MAIPYVSSYDVTTPFSDVCEQFSLTANNVQTYTIPGTASNKYSADFGYNATANIFVGKNVTAATPASGTKTSTPYLEFRPEKHYVSGGDVLSFVSPDTTAYCGVSLRGIPG